MEKHIMATIVRVIAIFSLLFFLWSHEEARAKDVVSELLDQAKKELDGKQYDKAIATCSEIVKTNPDVSAAYLYRGVAYAKVKRNEVALRDLDKAIEIDNTNYKAYYNRGVIFTEKGDLIKAIDNLTEAILRNPSDPDCYCARSIVYRKREDYDRSLQDSSKSLQIKPDCIEAYHSLALTYQAMKKYDKALENINIAIKIAPKLPLLYINRGAIYSNMGVHEEAIININEAIKLGADDCQAYKCFANIYIDMKKWDEAISYLTKAIASNKNDYEAYHLRGRCSIKKTKEQLNYALADLNEAIKLEPKFLEAYYDRAIVYQLLGNTSNSKEDGRKIEELSSNPDIQSSVFYNKMLKRLAESETTSDPSQKDDIPKSQQ
jgi:tetratricopeptide (TPR) repeat protein